VQNQDRQVVQRLHRLQEISIRGLSIGDDDHASLLSLALESGGDELHFMDHILDVATTAEKKLASFTHGHTATLLQAKRMQIDVRDF